jgi:D-xylose transport system substrate-binding protein
VTVTRGRSRHAALVAALLTAALPAIAWAQSPSPSAGSPAPSASATQPAATPLASAAPSAGAPTGSPSASASPTASSSAAPAWTPAAISGPVTLLTAGLEGDARAVALRDAFGDTLDESCPQATLVSHSADSAETQAEQARGAVAAGASVLVIDPVDPAATGAIVTEAQAAGVPVIAIGDTITGAVPDLQVAYDDPATGSLIGAVVVQVAADAADAALGDDATPIPSDAPVEQVVLIDGPDGDAGLAAWVESVKSGLGARATVVHEASVSELTAVEGKRVIAEAISALTIDGFGAVVTPGDAVAAGVIAGLQEAGVDPQTMSVTGLGGSLPGTQAVVLRDQLLTTWASDVSAAHVAAALACGQASGLGLPTGMTTTPVNNGTGDVATVLLTPVIVTPEGKDSAQGTRSVADTIVADQAFGPDTVALICTQDVAEACDGLGLVIPSPSPAASGSPAAGSAAPGSPAASMPSGSPGGTSPGPSTPPASEVPATSGPGASASPAA